MLASVAGWVLENGQAAVIPDVNAEPLHFKGADQAANFVTRSLMAVPITFQGEKLGVLEVSTRPARPIILKRIFPFWRPWLPSSQCHPECTPLGEN